MTTTAPKAVAAQSRTRRTNRRVTPLKPILMRSAVKTKYRRHSTPTGTGDTKPSLTRSNPSILAYRNRIGLYNAAMLASCIPARADHIGSLLRPKKLREAFRAHSEKRMDDAQLRAAQDEAIRDVVRLQEDCG